MGGFLLLIQIESSFLKFELYLHLRSRLPVQDEANAAARHCKAWSLPAVRWLRLAVASTRSELAPDLP
jgi:hypothetical protein